MGSYVIFLLLLLLFLDYNNQVVYSIILIIKQYSMKSGLKMYNPGGITLIKTIKIITIIQKYQGFEVLEFYGTFSLYDQEFSRNFMVYLHWIIKYIIKRILEFICTKMFM